MDEQQNQINQPIETDIAPQQPVEPTPPPAPKKKSPLLLVLLVVLVLLAGGAAAYFLVFKKDAASTDDKTANSQQSSQQTAAKNADMYYQITTLPGNGAYSEDDLVRIDPKTGTKTSVYKTKSNATTNYSESIIGVRNVNNVERVFLHTNLSKDGNTITSLAYVDAGKELKTFYTVTSPENGANMTFVYPGFTSAGIPHSGKFLDVLETTSTTAELKRVAVDGTASTLAKASLKGSTIDWGTPGFTYITAAAYSDDDSILYLNSHGCMQCDGAGKADVVKFDAATKKFSMAFTNPVPNTSGYWNAVADNTFLVTITNQNALGESSYEDQIKAINEVYLYDAKANTSTKVGSASAAESEPHYVGRFEDGKTLYFTTSMVEKAATFLNDSAASGHDWTARFKALKGYDVATKTFKEMALPIDISKTSLAAFNTFEGNYALLEMGYGTNGSRFDSAAYEASKNTLSLLKPNATELTQIAEFKANGGYFKAIGFTK